MMLHDSQVARMMHDEHHATLSLMERLEAAASARQPPDDANDGFRRLVNELRVQLDGELERHFRFEEDHLFPRLTAAGEDDIAIVLRGEHDAVREVSALLQVGLTEVTSDGWDDAHWTAFRRQAAELAERLIAHVQKEELGLLPVLPDVLEPEEDADLAMTYQSA